MEDFTVYGALNFNSHAHEGRDLWETRLLLLIVDFNSHAHEGRDRSRCRLLCAYSYFNSHAHEGRDALIDYLGLSELISTHTPTRGVTSMLDITDDRIAFQLTRPRGA